ncbi:NADH-FMN oxidoreductase RutF, flavin reductase (DIM6/NTAB) family [Chitinophaga jiangningensis]|uniref:NADH-FMN oxidoreductase RutF, flavin reductase (DIM6/NTAB) family n=1 Tax=Chitinophaga jiangningensis TaxID=1419482 RepID=A0A1M7E1D6_9BACT|nr:flavin reductase family protein [Chitinophaga jiangningensis]SHL85527.1 NADH-FMN oxidoreductase RutF, flavin reductase (DIM6/NTAB) family [Chitinophaga jiangningensis]
MQIDPKSIKTSELHAYLLGAISPRPICFASTVNKEGVPNLSPFSFFNVFGSNPVTLIFSPARRVRDNTVKHTLENIQATGQVVINVVNYAMVQQTSLASCEYPAGINEFEKAGFTALASEKVRPFRVKESPVQFECVVREVIATGQEGGAGNLVICEPVFIHINEGVLDAQGKIDPHKIDLVARMGGDYYCRASGDAVFEVAKPNTQLGIGVDALPLPIRQSNILTGNNLGQLGNVHEIPVIDPAFEDDHLKQIVQYYSITPDEMEKELHTYAQRLLAQNKVQEAWQVLLSGNV